MAKFKVGDMVKPKDGHYTGCTRGSKYNLPRTAMKVVTAGDGYLMLDVGDDVTSPPVNPDSFYLDPQAGPVRTVTRREIVPGFYGDVEIGEVDIKYDAYFDAESLRDAAHLFNQLAEVLAENGA
ncbi:hypothetical protein LB521_27615 [Mesorhizobium sp. BR-1-1-8]|uniref:hypothetical protein n=1 Tax=Mesorhizobium sp. BR-1-1-8 TaxID=2876659 RepID=UPI001CCC8DCC|nr:hypothetical protein [Mesorhizobium sp. BR-1-1-8]MBZ9984905.1 hypothetical protein [Mesorhizobium sp. BR-1-1-8]